MLASHQSDRDRVAIVLTQTSFVCCNNSEHSPDDWWHPEKSPTDDCDGENDIEKQHRDSKIQRLSNVMSDKGTTVFQ